MPSWNLRCATCISLPRWCPRCKRSGPRAKRTRCSRCTCLDRARRTLLAAVLWRSRRSWDAWWTRSATFCGACSRRRTPNCWSGCCRPARLTGARFWSGWTSSRSQRRAWPTS
ncbi:hypothetical protein T484DRAFT_1972253 [Baffinella frigidus]|nr:hypothetical protein T484DRAFT_1972253 [Cryptophyta sp. CCMP2293]